MSRFAFFTHRKAGSQWITDVLSDYRILACVPQIRFKRAPNSEYDLTAFVHEESSAFVAPIFDASYSLWNALRGPNDRAIWVGRDPRDAAVSSVYSMAFSHVSNPFISLVRAPLLTLDNRRRLMIGAFMLIGDARRTLRSWGNGSSHCYVTTFERVVEAEEREFAAMFEFFGWRVPDDVLRDVVSSHSFNVRSGGRERGESDPFSHYRQGIAGDWRNHFDRDLARQFEEACPHLLVDLGYENDDRWWESVGVHVQDTFEDGNVHEAHLATDRRVHELSAAMAGALEERDRRWIRHEAAMNARAATLERELETLRLACDERLAVIQDQEKHLEARLAALHRQDAEMQHLRSEAATLMSICAERLGLIEEQARVIGELREALDREQRG